MSALLLPDTYEELKRLFDSLTSQRELLEIEADAIHSELTSPGLNGEPPAGIKEPLVDSEGFPRSDIDIYNVRNKRKRLSEINTDHKDLMKKLEQITPKLFTLSQHKTSASTEQKQSSTIAASTTSVAATVRGTDQEPIAKLDEILSGSPAQTAGVQENDELLQFGHVTANDPKAFASIAKLVGESVQRPIILKIRRSGEVMDLSLTPQPWGGRGLLGCHLTPIKR
jgi:26S proteasome non-ATPase regulatory subunit 9